VERANEGGGEGSWLYGAGGRREGQTTFSGCGNQKNLSRSVLRNGGQGPDRGKMGFFPGTETGKRFRFLEGPKRGRPDPWSQKEKGGSTPAFHGENRNRDSPI